MRVLPVQVLIGKYILGGRLAAILSTATSALLSLLLPPLAYLISGTVVALVTLRKGAAYGYKTMAASLLLLVLFTLIAGLPPQLAIGYALAIWLPVSIVAVVLRWTESQGLTLLAAGTLSGLFIVSMYVLLPDVPALWQNWFARMLEQSVPAEEIARYQEALEPAAVLFNAIISVGVMLNMMMSVLLARWWQSKLFNQGAFRKEFFALRLPSVLLPVSGALVVLTFVLSGAAQGMVRDLLFIMVFMYMVQGVSSVHRVVQRYGMSSGWLVMMYCMLILVPQIGVLIACLGMTDVYVNWRKKNEPPGTDQ